VELCVSFGRDDFFAAVCNPRARTSLLLGEGKQAPANAGKPGAAAGDQRAARNKMTNQQKLETASFNY